MDFRTEIEPIEGKFKLTPKSKIITIGSCFSEVIGSQLTENKLECLCNPFGTVFNPVSIFKLLHTSLTNQPLNPNFFIEKDGIWNHYDFHSRFWSDSVDTLEDILENQLCKIRSSLRSYDVLLITFGTSFVYQLKKNKQVVANCHKQPKDHFVRELITTKEIIHRFTHFYDTLRLVNSKMKILVTVSPVRHTRDTLQMNSVSKSILRTACYELEQAFENVHYFPSYEIMMDDLRDYRFYTSDLIHPNEQAEEYIYEKFSTAYFSDELLDFQKEWQKIKSALNHRPIKQDSPSHQKFLSNLLNNLQQFQQKVDVAQEIAYVESQLV